MSEPAVTEMEVPEEVPKNVTLVEKLSAATAYTYVAAAKAFPSAITPRASLKSIQPLKPFSPWQVESLLGQVQELLERNQRERVQYDDLRMKALETALQVYSEAMELEQIELRLDKLNEPSPIYQLNQKAEEALATASENAANNNLALDRDGSATWNEVWAHQLAGQTLAQNAHSDVARESMVAERFRTFLEKRLRDESAPAQRLRARLAKADADRFNETAKYLRHVADVKAEALKPGGPLHLSSRVSALGQQIAQDFDDAYIRLESAYEGLTRFFGYTGDKLPLRTDPPENISVWTRKAISWMVSFSHIDQAASVVLRLGKVASDDWQAKKKAFNEGEEVWLEFFWNGDSLSDFAHVRLTGVAMSLQGDTTCLVEANIRPPRQARIQLIDGSMPTIYQPVDFCRLGKVETRNSGRSSEICGIVSLRNTSPMSGEMNSEGHWLVRLKKIAGNEITDVFIELSLNVVTK